MLLFACSFDDIGSTAGLLNYFSSTSSAAACVFAPTAGTNGGGALHVNDDDHFMRITLPTAHTQNNTIRLAAWTKVTSSDGDWMLKLWDAVFGNGSGIWMDATSQINVRGWNAGIGAMNLPLITVPCSLVGGYHCLELAIKYADAGSAKIWLDGNVIYDQSLDLLVTGLADIKNVEFYGQLSDQWWDDILIWNDIDNGDGFIGEIGASKYRLTTVLPDADGDDSQFTALGGGSKYLEVDDTGDHDSDTSYVESATSGHRQLYGFGALPTSPTSIKGVVSNMWVRNPDIGAMNFKHKAKSGATLAEGASLLAPASYGLTQRAFSVDPNTAAAWSKAGVDAAQFGIEVV